MIIEKKKSGNIELSVKHLQIALLDLIYAYLDIFGHTHINTTCCMLGMIMISSRLICKAVNIQWLLRGCQTTQN